MKLERTERGFYRIIRGGYVIGIWNPKADIFTIGGCMIDRSALKKLSDTRTFDNTQFCDMCESIIAPGEAVNLSDGVLCDKCADFV